MSDKSKIEWTQATWNPVTGCHKVSQGCKNCYAERDWKRLAAPREKPNVYTGRAFTDVQCHPERLKEPLRWTKPRMVFVNSMSDLFHEDVPDEFIDKVFAVMALCPSHTFQILTKRPERMQRYLGELVDEIRRWERFGDATGPIVGNLGYDAAYAGWPLRHVWLGVSVEDQAAADERISLLLKTPAAVRWISAEPLLGPLDFSGERLEWLEPFHDLDPMMYRTPRLDWVVVGGESGPNARPMHPSWARSIRDQCQAAGVPFFFKQWGEWEPRELWSPGPVMQIAIDKSGSVVPIDVAPQDVGGQRFVRVGKKAAGRVLDGRTWDEYPKGDA